MTIRCYLVKRGGQNIARWFLSRRKRISHQREVCRLVSTTSLPSTMLYGFHARVLGGRCGFVSTGLEVNVLGRRLGNIGLCFIGSGPALLLLLSTHSKSVHGCSLSGQGDALTGGNLVSWHFWLNITLSLPILMAACMGLWPREVAVIRLVCQLTSRGALRVPPTHHFQGF